MNRYELIGGATLCAAAVLWVGGAFAGNAASLQSQLDRGGDVRFPSGEYVIERTLVVSPGTHLVCAPGFRARLADGANCAILANRNPLTGHVADISIEGGVWDGNNQRQDRSKYTESGFTPRLRYGMGAYGQLIVFSGVRGLKLKGLTVKDPQGFGIMLTDTENFTVEDIVFDCNDRTPNEDGVHINGFARHGVVRRVRGHTNDDLVALNSDEGDWRSSDCTIDDILIEDLDGGERGYTGVRLLSRDARVRNVTIRRVRGRFQFNVVSFTHWAQNAYKPGMGHFDNVLIEDITATSCRKSGTGHGGLIWFQEGVQDVGTVRIRNLRRVESADYLNDTCTIEVSDRVRIRRLELENVTQDIPDDKPLVKVSPTALCAIARATGTAFVGTKDACYTVSDAEVFVDNRSRGRSGHMGHALIDCGRGRILAFNSNVPTNRCDGHSGYGWMEYRVSKDYGRTWDAPRVLDYSMKVFKEGKHTALCEKGVRAPDGRIILFFQITDASRPISCEPWSEPTWIESRDVGETWSDARVACPERGRIYDAVVDGNSVYFLLPTSPNFCDTNQEYVVYKSTNGGPFVRHATSIDGARKGYGAMEFAPDGSLVVYAYDSLDEAHPQYCISRDCGVTWEQPGRCMCAKLIRNPQVRRIGDDWFMCGRNGQCWGNPGSGDGLVLYHSKNGIDWDAGVKIAKRPDGTGTGFYSCLLPIFEPGRPPRLLLQYSRPYWAQSVNVEHRWIEPAGN